MSDETPKEEKKIIVDEDWKEQVEAEREELRQKEGEAPQPTDEPPPEPPAEEAAAESPADEGEMPVPPASLAFLFGSMYLQGMIALGMLPNPVDNKPAVNLKHARHTIDMLAMLEEKTEGNRTQEESDELERILHELRMTFLTVQQTK